MSRMWGRWYRICMTGVAFVTFGVGAALLSYTIIPLLRLTVRTSSRRRILRRIIRSSFRCLLTVLRMAGVCRVSLSPRDRELLRSSRECVIVANHPTYIDVVILLSHVEGAECVVKRALFKNPLTRAIVREAGYVTAEDAEYFLEVASERLMSGAPLIVFPEGTRSPVGGMHPFQRGAAALSVKTGYDLLPVIITCDPPALSKRDRWFDVPTQRFVVTLRVGARKRGRITGEMMSLSRAARKLTGELEDYFRTELFRDERQQKKATHGE